MLFRSRILDLILSEYQHSGPVAIGIAKALRGRGSNMDEFKIVYARLTICKVIATSLPHDDSWYNLVSNELGIPETSLRDYAAHGDRLSLVILIHFVRLQFIHFRESTSLQRYRFSFVLARASNFDVRDTSPELQHKFCALWNQIVNKVQVSGDREMAHCILSPIRDVYLALHQGNDSAPAQSASAGYSVLESSSYPVCKVPHHHSDSTPHIYDDGVSTTQLARTIPYDLVIPPFVTPITNPDQPSSSIHAPPVGETLTDALRLDNQISVQGSTQPIGQTRMTAEYRRIPTTCAVRRSVDSSRSMRSSTSSSPPNSNASASVPADIAVVLTALSCTPSGDLNAHSESPPSSPVLAWVLDPFLPTGLLLFSDYESI